MKVKSQDIVDCDSWDTNHRDLRAALDNNSIPFPSPFILLAEVLSEHHDEGQYFWLIHSSVGYQVISGDHDYTGWDCQSSARITTPFKFLDELHLHCQEYDNQNRPVRKMLLKQALKDRP